MLEQAGTVSGPYADTGDGKRAMRIDWPRVTLLIQGTCEGPSTPMIEATEIARHPIVIRELTDRVSDLVAQIASLTAKLPPEEPAKMLGTGCVRFADGFAHLLNNAESGWSAFGVRFRSWDELFREYDVRIGEPQTDKWGQYWPAEPM